MRPLTTWPRWALLALRAILIRVPVLPAMLFRLDLEIWSRDVTAWEDAIAEAEEKAWACAPIGGVQ